VIAEILAADTVNHTRAGNLEHLESSKRIDDMSEGRELLPGSTMKLDRPCARPSQQHAPIGRSG
jgi:hypothetical protein